jgi:uncharacterized protein (TIGR02145 family)
MNKRPVNSPGRLAAILCITEATAIHLLIAVAAVAMFFAGCTKGEIPVIIATDELSIITTNSATGGGMIVYGEETGIVSRGLVWSTRHDPSVEYHVGKTSHEGNGNKFSDVIRDLEPSTVYYVRAYAINKTGISYGDEKSFKTYYGSITDIEENSYYTIKTNGQEWISSNLMTGRYNNGDIIPNIKEPSAWSTLATGGWAAYNNDENLKRDYGNLYNWHAVNDERGLCPAGWRVPSDQDWKVLEIYLGMPPATVTKAGVRDNYAGGKLKKTGTTHWSDPNAVATDEIGFSALPGGYRHPNGEFSSLRRDMFAWSSTSNGFNGAWYRNLYALSAGINRDVFHKNGGFSVRCIADHPTVNQI